jgi:hypothetical protein
LRIAHETTNSMLATREAFRETASDFSGRTGQEDLHGS